MFLLYIYTAFVHCCFSVCTNLLSISIAWELPDVLLLLRCCNVHVNVSFSVPHPRSQVYSYQMTWSSSAVRSASFAQTHPRHKSPTCPECPKRILGTCETSLVKLKRDMSNTISVISNLYAKVLLEKVDGCVMVCLCVSRCLDLKLPMEAGSSVPYTPFALPGRKRSKRASMVALEPPMAMA